jgi:hypothetical protein
MHKKIMSEDGKGVEYHDVLFFFRDSVLSGDVVISVHYLFVLAWQSGALRD